MKNTLSLIGLSFLFLTPSLSAQNQTTDFQASFSEYKFPENDAQHPCISPEEYTVLNQEVTANLTRLGLQPNPNKNTLTTNFIWPLRLATGFTQCEYHFIGAYVDQNTATTAIQDFNCETNTYDGHHGTDIAIWPYSFYKMDNNQVEVIAAAAGTIVQKADGNFDRNCSSNALTANSIILQHADGSESLYWHMKNGSVTTKTVGQTVVAGEKLGVVGSSGSSSGPHLHFEVWSGNTNTTYKDPFAGSCNILNANSWWVSQRPHTEPAIMKVSVNTSDFTLAACPNSDIPNDSDTFLVPFQGVGLAPGYAKFYIFLREIPANSSFSLRIVNPNGSTFNSWNYTIPTYYKVSYLGFSKLLPTIDGTYTFEAIYNGVTCSRPFTIVHSLGIPDLAINDFTVFPNPTTGSFTIFTDKIDNGKYTLSITTLTGQLVESEKINIENNTLDKSFTATELSAGIYFLILDTDNFRTIKKIIKN